MTNRELDEALSLIQDELVELADHVQVTSPLIIAKLVKLISEVHLIRETLYA